MIRDKQIRPCTSRGLVACLRPVCTDAKSNQAWSLVYKLPPPLKGEGEKTFIFSSSAALISVSEDISIPNVINIVKPSVVIPSVSVPSTSSWNPSAWGTWPFITISGISGEQHRNIHLSLLKYNIKNTSASFFIVLNHYEHLHLTRVLPQLQTSPTCWCPSSSSTSASSSMWTATTCTTKSRTSLCEDVG